jgi:ABC-2 type transport system ATP-binding protein
VTNAIETINLVKTFGTTRALDGLNLTIRGGSVYGLLGPNGAGKTTAIRVLATLLKPTSGTASVLGHDVVHEAAAVRQKVSLTGQYASVDEELTGSENLVLVGRLLGLSWTDARKRAAELLEAFGLKDAGGRLVRTFSGGMRRRIDIAASLAARSEVLFLDEPTTGLDPRSRNQVWDLIREIAAEGTTVLLTTQYLEEADRLAERLAVIDHGRVIAEGTSRELKASVDGNALRLHLARPEQQAEARAVISSLLGDRILPGTDGTAISVKVQDASVAADVLGALSRAQVQLQDFSLGAPSLDDVFFALTGRPAEPKPDEDKEDLA